MIGRRGFLAAGAALLASGLQAGRATAASGVERVQQLAEIARGELNAPGFCYGVVRGDDVAFKSSVGLKELGRDDPVTSSTLFHLGSVTKPFLATALAQRVDQGKLKWSQRVVDVVPEFRLADSRAASITIEHLLTHSSGLPRVEDYGWSEPETDEGSLRRYVAGLSSTSLLFAPGSAYGYSDVGYDVLARVIEVLDGVAFETALQRTLFAPLGMNDSTLLKPAANEPQPAAPHVVNAAGKLQPSVVFPYNRRHAGSKTLLSSLDDMLIWLRVNLNEGALGNARVIAAAAARDVRTPRAVEIDTPGYPPGIRAGLGWFVLPRAQREIIVHGSGDLGFVSLCLFCPQDRYGLIVMANCATPDAAASLRKFAFAAIDERALLAAS